MHRRMTYCCHPDYIVPESPVSHSNEVLNNSLLTAWYDGVRVVILCLFLAYSKKKSLTFSAIWRMSHLRRHKENMGWTYLSWWQERPPLVNELCKHAIRPTLVNLPESTKYREFIVGHAHINLLRIQVSEDGLKNMSFLPHQLERKFL